MQVEFSIGDALGSNAIAYVVFIIEVPLEFALSIVDCALDHHGVEVIQFREHLIVHVRARLCLGPLFSATENCWLPYLDKNKKISDHTKYNLFIMHVLILVRF